MFQLNRLNFYKKIRIKFFVSDKKSIFTLNKEGGAGYLFQTPKTRINTRMCHYAPLLPLRGLILRQPSKRLKQSS